MAGPQGCGRAAHGCDALAGHVGGVGLAEHLAADLEHRVASDDEDGLAGGKLGVPASERLADVGAAARALTSSAGVVEPPLRARPPGREARRASSSTVETRTIGVMPAALSVARRAGEAEARTRRMHPLWTTVASVRAEAEKWCKKADCRR